MRFVLGEMAQLGLELIEYEETEDKSTQDNAQTEVLVPRRPAKTAQAQAPQDCASPSSGAMRRAKITPTDLPPVESD